MMDTTAPTEKANGLVTYLSVLTSPTAAFTQLAKTPMWGWAAIGGIVLAIISIFISMPELMKVAAVAQAAQLATMPADQQAQAKQTMAAAAAVTKVIIIVSWVIIPWIAWLISALVYTVGAAISGAAARFSLAWAASVNVSIVAWVGAVVNAVILAARGPDAISSPLDAQALPSLGMLVHGPKLIAFLNAYNLDYIWLYIVAVIALERMLAMKRPAAVTTVLVYSLITAGLAAAFAK
jgi:hypothetical protein